MNVFFSWQSDRPTRSCRNLIERALGDAVKVLSEDSEVEPAIREKLKVDSDTKGIPGSPAVFNTILEKIKNAAAFVPDLTFVGVRPNGEPTPNPNVLIEYGWALRCLTEQRIIGVMNTAYGEPESLPFDLAHHRFPIRFNLPEDATDAQRSAAREDLAARLRYALKTLFDSELFRRTISAPPTPTLFPAREALQGKARFRAKGSPLGQLNSPLRRIVPQTPRTIKLAGGPALYLRVMPHHSQNRKLRLVEIETQTSEISILALTQSSGSISSLTASDGFGYFPSTGDVTAPSVCFTFDTGEIWSINAWARQVNDFVGKRVIGFEETMFSNSLRACVRVIKRLGFHGPFRWIAGIEDVEGYYLLTSRATNALGPFLTPEIEETGIIEGEEGTDESLRAFFRRVYDMCDAPFL